MGETLITFVLFINFFSFVCVFGFFYDLQTIRIQCFGEKKVVSNLSVTHLLLDILSSTNHLKNTLAGNSPPKNTGKEHVSTDTHTHTLNDSEFD